MTAPTPATPTPAAAAPATGTAFFTRFLQGLGITPNAQNLAALEDVRHYEGNNNRYNPLNAVQVEPGSTQFNSVGVQTYPDFATGVAGEVALFGGSHWTAVRQALQTGNEQSILSAFDAGYTWSPGTNIPALTAQSQATEAGTLVGPGAASTGTLQTVANSTTGGVQPAFDVLPGGKWDPFNWPTEALGGAASDAANATVHGIEGIISTLTRPFLSFVENAFLVIAGFTLLLVGLIILGHVASNSGSKSSSGSKPAPSSSGRSSSPSPASSSKSERSGSEPGEAAGGGEAADAAVLA